MSRGNSALEVRIGEINYCGGISDGDKGRISGKIDISQTQGRSIDKSKA